MQWSTSISKTNAIDSDHFLEGCADDHQHLFPFGYSVGDHAVQRVDDGSSDPLVLNQPFIFFGRRYNQVIVGIDAYYI